MICKHQSFTEQWRAVKVLVGAFLLISGQALAQQTAPNIIFIVADDMGYGDSNAYNPNSKVSMPNLAQLASEGVVFTRAYTATPKCAPSRYSYLTGNYQWRGRGSFGWWHSIGGSQVLDGQDTIANSLAAQYNTLMVGKYHLGGNFYSQGSNSYMALNDDPDLADFSRPMQDGARSRGFDYSYILLRGIQDSPYAYFENDMLASPLGELQIWPIGSYNTYSEIVKAGIGANDYDSSEVGAKLMHAAISQLTDIINQPNGKPFFFYYPSVSSHYPNTPPDYYYGIPIRGTQFSRPADMLFQLDNALGLLLDFLNENNLAANTLIIFTSDNGGGMSTRQNYIDNFDHDVNGGLRGGKGEIWDGGVRIPLVMRWGDGTLAGSTLPTGTVNNQLIALQDLPATLNALNGNATAYDQMKDSYNMLAELLEPGNGGKIRESIVLEARNSNGAAVPAHFAIVEQDWKLVLDNNDQPDALFDMKNDGNETTDLLPAGQHNDVADRLREKLLTLRSAPRSAPVPDLIPQNADPIGPPQLESFDQGIFISGGIGDGTVEVAVKAAGSATKITNLTMLADQPFEWVTPNSLETNRDVLTWNGDNLITLTSYSSGSPDGFTAKLPTGATAVASISDTSDITDIRYGADKRSRGSQLILNNRRGVTEAIEPGMNGGLIMGKPVLSGTDQGIFLWTESSDGTFEIAVQGAAGQSLIADLEIFADADFEQVDPVGLEAGDTLTWAGGNSIQFSSDATSEVDGFRAKLPAGSTFFTIIGTTNVEADFAYGLNKEKATPNAWYLPLSQLSHNGTAESTRLLANMSVASSPSVADQVDLRWRGDGSGTAFLVDLLFDAAVTQATSSTVSPLYQDIDTTQNSVSASAFLLNELGGVNVQVPGANDIGIYFHNANGQIPDYLVNLPAGLGAPNAHRVKLQEPPSLPPGCS